MESCENSKKKKLQMINGFLSNGGKAEKYNIQSDIKTLLGRYCEVEKIMKFLKDTDIEEI